MSNIIITRHAIIFVRSHNLRVEIHRLPDGGVCDFLLEKPLASWHRSMPDSHVWIPGKGLQTLWLDWILGFLKIPQADIDAISTEVANMYECDEREEIMKNDVSSFAELDRAAGHN